MNLPEIELISFDLCPFVQRSIITLLHKNIPFKRTNIDLQSKPDWFLKISPLGKVPVMKMDGDILFESAVINEYLDEITPPSLHPNDPKIKAHNRAWIEFGSQLLSGNFRMLTTQDEEKLTMEIAAFNNKLAFLENAVGNGPYFNGDKFSLVDTAYAPLFVRLLLVIQPATHDNWLKNFPKLNQWANVLLAEQSVQSSLIEDYVQLATDRFKSKGILLQSA